MPEAGSRTAKKTTKQKTTKAKTATKAKAPAKAKTTKAKTATKAKAAAKAKPAAAKQPVARRLRVKQVRSGIGHSDKLRRTLGALGLKHQREVVVGDNPSMRGMLHRVRHLVLVTPEEG